MNEIEEVRWQIRELSKKITIAGDEIARQERLLDQLWSARQQCEASLDYISRKGSRMDLVFGDAYGSRPGEGGEADYFPGDEPMRWEE